MQTGRVISSAHRAYLGGRRSIACSCISALSTRFEKRLVQLCNARKFNTTDLRFILCVLSYNHC